MPDKMCTDALNTFGYWWNCDRPTTLVESEPYGFIVGLFNGVTFCERTK
jgi:hypothetical protein